MDEVDRSEEQVEAFLKHSIANKRRAAPAYSGRCFNCEQELPEPQRWCDSDCREDWLKREDR